MKMPKQVKKMMDRIRKRRKLTKEESREFDFDKLITEARPHILEKICLSLDYETFKNCLKVNKAWREVLASKTYQPKVQSTFREDIANEENTLIQMSEDGGTEEVKRILSSGLIKVDCNDKKLKPWQQIGPRTPLIYAATEGHADIVRLLIQAGADVNQEGPLNSNMGPDDYEESPLMVAANYNHFEVVKLLIEAGAVPDRVDQFGKTPLLLAAWNSKMPFGNLIPWERETPIAVMKLLLDKGADANNADEYGTTPLIAAAYMGDCEVANLLLDRGADIEKASSTSWRAPLMTAVAENNIDMVRLLIDRGADVIHGDGTINNMGLAMEKGYQEIMVMLFNKYKASIAPAHLAKLTLEEFLAYDSD